MEISFSLVKRILKSGRHGDDQPSFIKMFILTIIVLLITTTFFWDYNLKRRRNSFFKKSKITGPMALPILGCGLEMLHLGPEAIIPYFGRLFNKYGSTFRLWMLHEAQLYTTDVRVFEAVLSSTTELQKGDLYDLLRSWLNDGLLLSIGRKWRARRKIFTPAFHFKMLEHFVRIMDEQSELMARKLESHANESEVNVFEFVGLAALDIISEAAMGVKVNAQLQPKCAYVQALKRVTYIQSDRLYKINQRYDSIFKLTAPTLYNELQMNIAEMHKFTHKVIEDRRSILERSKANGTYRPLTLADDEIGLKEQMAFLDILLQASIDGRALTNQEICEEVDTFTFEGDDTTTSGVSHALYCISRDSTVQEKLFKEILNVIGCDKHAPITMRQLQELKYLECVVKEVLRLYPAVPAVGRRTQKDIQIGELLIPANTNVYVVMYYAHRNPVYFKDPEKFRPERFLDENENELKKEAFAYTPFSAGPKNCIGQRFAMLEMKALISKILRHYELLPKGPDVTPMMNFILRSPCGMNLGLRPRNYSA